MSKEFTVHQVSIVATIKMDYYQVKAESKEEAVRFVEEGKYKPTRSEIAESPLFCLDPEMVDALGTKFTLIDNEVIKDNVKSIQDCAIYHIGEAKDCLIKEFLGHIQTYLSQTGTTSMVRLTQPVFVTDYQDSKVINRAIHSIEINGEDDIKFLTKVADDAEDVIIPLEEISPLCLPFVCKCIDNEN